MEQRQSAMLLFEYCLYHWTMDRRHRWLIQQVRPNPRTSRRWKVGNMLLDYRLQYVAEIDKQRVKTMLVARFLQLNIYWL